MSSEPTVSQEPGKTPKPPATPTTSRPVVQFSGPRWAVTGVVRLMYRSWTRVAARIFPEDSRAEEIAKKLHLPLPDQLNMSWVTDHLAVGGRVHPDDIKTLARIGVNHVIDTRSEYADDVGQMADEHIELLHLPAPDTYPLSVEQLTQGAAWANERLKRGERVLVHCEHGVGRSVLLTCAILVYGGMHARDALALVQQKRWQAAPNHRQVARLREFEAAVSRRNA